MIKLLINGFVKLQLFIVSMGLISLLTGCQSLFFQKEMGNQAPIKEVETEEVLVIDTPPQIVKTTDWNSLLIPYINSLLSSLPNETSSNLLLISDIQNRTGGYLATNQIIQALHSLMNEQHNYTILSNEEINQAKQEMDITVDDEFVSRRKMFGLAKKMKADYILFTTVYQSPTDTEDANLSVELLSTQTGEILKRISSRDLRAIDDNNDSIASDEGDNNNEQVSQ